MLYSAGADSAHVCRGLAWSNSLAYLHLEDYTEPELPSPLPALIKLYIGGGSLRSLPEGFDLPELRHLAIHNTQPEPVLRLPDSLSLLTKLTHLMLALLNIEASHPESSLASCLAGALQRNACF